MKIYLIMGTHMAEIRHFIDYLDKFSDDPSPVEVYLPTGLEWASDSYTVECYDAEDILWVFDPDKEATVFIVIDPRTDLLEQLEQLAEDLAKCLIEPVKIMTCVDSQQTEDNPQLRGWYDACIYYSDLVLLGNRANAAKAFIRDYQKHYERLCYPCLFLLLKNGGIPSHPAEILTPGIRRISQLFDLKTGQPEEPLPGMVIESSCDLDLEETEADPFRDPADETSANPVPDPSRYIIPPQ